MYNLLYEVMSPGPGHILKVTAPFSILNVSVTASFFISMLCNLLPLLIVNLFISLTQSLTLTSSLNSERKSDFLFSVYTKVSLPLPQSNEGFTKSLDLVN